VDVSLNLLPLTGTAKKVTIRGDSADDFLSFRWSGTVTGGLNRRFRMTANAPLPTAVAAYYNRRITWSIDWNDTLHEIAPLLGHTVFVTIDRPIKPEEVTYRRIAKAIEIVGPLGTLEPHEIVAGIMKTWNVYNLSVRLPNAWTLADDLATGAQCIDIVRFVLGVLQVIGCPGDADPVVVWANPADPRTAIEQYYRGPVGLHTVGSHPAHPSWFPGLLDASWHSNAFEAALKFSHGGRLAYYPGGVDAIFSTAQEVLEIFRCLAYITGTGGMNCRIMEVPADYPPGPCPVGSEHTCFVS
jgi:hypothetical protein